MSVYVSVAQSLERLNDHHKFTRSVTIISMFSSVVLYQNVTKRVAEHAHLPGKKRRSLDDHAQVSSLLQHHWSNTRGCRNSALNFLLEKV